MSLTSFWYVKVKYIISNIKLEVQLSNELDNLIPHNQDHSLSIFPNSFVSAKIFISKYSARNAYWRCVSDTSAFQHNAHFPVETYAISYICVIPFQYVLTYKLQDIYPDGQRGFDIDIFSIVR